MVKLMVTVRVIPEDLYLSALEVSSTHNTLIRGEKRFCVIVREPELWYIGTLALEIKRRYESIYKHDLGQIKYLKDNTDDCDLDPEFCVADALVDEGKALSDPSDQRITIKVVQEQGRDVRQGSVVPDLSQVHYRIPEQPARPPIPTFQNVEFALGKRKAEPDMQMTNVERKRTRLDEIEETEILATVEHDHFTQPEVIVANSQPSRSSPVVAMQPSVQAPSSPEWSWSFSNIGPPTTVKTGSSLQQTRGCDVTSKDRADGHTDTNSITHSLALSKTPKTKSQCLTTPNDSGVPAISPLAAASIVSKKPLKPQLDPFPETESDIDNSQTSPSSRDTSRITPRLVHSRNLINRNSSVQDRDRDSSETRIIVRQQAEGEVIRDGTGSGKDNDEPKSNQDRHALNASELHATAEHRRPESSDREPVSGQKSPAIVKAENHATRTGVQTCSKDPLDQGDNKTKAGVAGSTGPHLVPEPPQSMHKSQSSSVSASISQHDVGDFTSEATSESSKRPESSRRWQRRNMIKADLVEQPKTPIAQAADRRLSSTRSAIAKPEHNATQPSTPEPDSASEQLSSALQESARKSVGSKMVQPRMADLVQDESSTNPKKMALQSSQNNVDELKIDRKSQAITQTASAPSDMNSALSSIEPNVPAVPDNCRNVRSLVDNHIVNSKPIVPPGMTLAEYDRLVKGNAHLNSVVSKESAATKGTPSLSHARSVESPAGNPNLSASKSKIPIKSITAQTATDLNSTSSVSESLPAGIMTEGTTATKNAKQSRSDTSEVSAVAKTAQASSSRSGIKNSESVTNKSDSPQAIIRKTPSLAASESVTSDRSQRKAAKASPQMPSTPSASTKFASRTSSLPSASAQQKQPIPTPSTAPKATSSTVSKRNAKEPVSSISRLMPPPSSSPVAKAYTMATPTPKPKLEPAASALVSNKPAVTRTVGGASIKVAKPATKPPLRPTLPPTFASAQNLQELRAMASSANNSTSGSPAPSISRFAQPKKSILDDDDSEDDSSADSSSSSDDATPPKTSSAKVPLPRNFTSTTRPVPRGQPDPTIRDASNDESSESDDDDDDDDDDD